MFLKQCLGKKPSNYQCLGCFVWSFIINWREKKKQGEYPTSEQSSQHQLFKQNTLFLQDCSAQKTLQLVEGFFGGKPSKVGGKNNTDFGKIFELLLNLGFSEDHLCVFKIVGSRKAQKNY